MAEPVAKTTTKRPSGVAVLRPERHAALTAALDAAVEGDPTLAGGRALLLAPLTLLDALARDAEGALGDDVLAAERFRLLLALAASQLPPVSALQQLVGESASGGWSSARPVPSAPCDHGVVHLGALVVVALAAGRVGKTTGLAEPLINNVLALSIAAGPAETLSRALATGMAPEQVRAVLAGLGARENGQDRRLSAIIASFLADPCERARWSVLMTLFDHVHDDIADHPWDAAGTGGIVDVEPRDACPGERIVIHTQPVIRIERANLSTSASPVLNAAHFLALAERRALDVVFAAQGRRSVARQPESVDPEQGRVEVIVPAGARVGWLGFADTELLAQSNDARRAVRAAWIARNQEEPGLRADPVPVESIPLLRDPPTPPRSPETRFDGGDPLLLEASLAPAVADPGETMRIRWRIEGAQAVRIDPLPSVSGSKPEPLKPEGTIELPAPLDRARVEFVLSAESRCGAPVTRRLRARVRVRIHHVDASQPGRVPGTLVPLVVVGAGLRAGPGAKEPPPLVEGEPVLVAATLSASDARGRAELVLGEETRRMRIDAGRATATLPARLAVDGLRGIVVFRGPDGKEEDRQEFGPLRFVAVRTRRLVVIRPALLIGSQLRRVGALEGETAMQRAGLRLGMGIDAAEPAWVDDDDLFLDGVVEGAHVPAADRLLDRLHTLAARSPGMEDAVFLALVPAAQKQELLRLEPAEGARAVAVCTPGELGRLLEAQLPEAEPRTRRLRMVGTVLDDGSVRLQPLRAEDRAAGPGAPVSTDLRAVALDAAGRVLASRPVRLMTGDRPARLVSLLPVTEEVTDVELRLPRDANPPLSLVLGLCGNDAFGHAHYTIARVHRTEGVPDLLASRLDAGRLRFDYAHSRSARSAVVVEVGGARGWTPVLRLGACAESAALPLDRLAFAQGERVRAAGTDGWNEALGSERGLALPFPGGRAVARHAGGSRFWADVADGESVRWSFGDAAASTPVVVLPPDFRGELVLTVGEGEGAVTDTRTIGTNGAVDDRSTRLPEEVRNA